MEIGREVAISYTISRDVAWQTRWSHDRGNKPQQVVPCSWQTTMHFMIPHGSAKCRCSIKRQKPWPLGSLLPIAAISWSGQVLSRSSSRVRFTGQLDGCGCPAVTDGLDGF